MSLRRTVLITAVVWVGAITVLHMWLNLNVRFFAAGPSEQAGRKLRIGFLPVT